MTTSSADAAGSYAGAPLASSLGGAKRLSLTPLVALAATAVFTLVVYAAHFGFAARWGDPLGYLFAVLKPLVLTAPAYVLLNVALGRAAWRPQLESLAKSVRLAALSVACYAPVIWFYSITSPSPTFPLIALIFGAVAFWVPLGIDLVRRAPGKKARLVAIAWVLLMGWAEGRVMVRHLARELVTLQSSAPEGRS